MSDWRTWWELDEDEDSNFETPLHLRLPPVRQEHFRERSTVTIEKNTLAHQHAEDERRRATWPETEPGMKVVVLDKDGDAWQRQWDDNPDDARWARASSGQQPTESWECLQRVLGPVRLLHPSPHEEP